MKGRAPGIIAVLAGLALSGCAGRPQAARPTPAAASRQASATSAPALALAAQVPWQPLYAGDPLRVVVQLASPRAAEELYRQSLAWEQGQLTPTPGFAAPEVPSTWGPAVTLNLYRLEPGGGRTPVLAGGAWAPYLLQPQGEPLEVDPGLGVHSQEWLAPPGAAPLAPGHYVLQVYWTGLGLVDAQLLGPGGALRAEDIPLEVREPAGDSAQATHLGRLAYAAYWQRRYEEARRLGREALALDPGPATPERMEAYLIVANSSLALKDYQAAAETYRDLAGRAPKGSKEALVAQYWLGVIGRLLQATPTPGPAD